MNTYLVVFAFIVTVLVFAACSAFSHGSKKIGGLCAHPAIQGGLAFPIPEGAYFTTYGALVLPVRDGTGATLTGATCIILRRVGGSGQ